MSAWRALRRPVLLTGVLLLLLAAEVTLGVTHPFPLVWIPQAVITLVMIALVLCVSMELLEEPALIRLFAAIGFVWVGILATLTMTDYLSR